MDRYPGAATASSARFEHHTLDLGLDLSRETDQQSLRPVHMLAQVLAAILAEVVITPEWADCTTPYPAALIIEVCPNNMIGR